MEDGKSNMKQKLSSIDSLGNLKLLVAKKVSVKPSRIEISSAQTGEALTEALFQQLKGSKKDVKLKYILRSSEEVELRHRGNKSSSSKFIFERPPSEHISMFLDDFFPSSQAAKSKMPPIIDEENGKVPMMIRL